jgi:hypothetical protein
VRRRVLIIALVLLLLAPGARALGFIDDPSVVYALEVVNNLLKAIEDVELAAHLTLQGEIKNLVRKIGFPAELFEPLEKVVSSVKGIRQEIEEISCDWQFSRRTSVLKDLYLAPFRLCRESFQAIWGTSQGRWDSDLHEFQDYEGTLSANLIAERARGVAGWQDIFASIEHDSALLRRSPGEANRDEAVALAGAGLIAHSGSAIASQTLLVRELDREMERFDERKRSDMGRFLLLSLAGEDPSKAGP